jgi:hypothetical protein
MSQQTCVVGGMRGAALLLCINTYFCMGSLSRQARAACKQAAWAEEAATKRVNRIQRLIERYRQNLQST